MYVEVHILERSDPNIILNLEHCWATAGPNPDSQPQWDLLVDGYKKPHTNKSLNNQETFSNLGLFLWLT